MDPFMKLAYEEAEKGVRLREGGPFGVVIVDCDGKVIAKAHNQVLAHHDPTAHAEIQALRTAGQVMQTHDLKGCSLYSTCEPCPMCLSAIIWANIREIYYACDRKAAAGIGFRDALLYEFFQEGGGDILLLRQIDREACWPLFEEYKKQNRELY